MLSLGDRRVATAIEAAERNGGQWRAAVDEAGLDADWYVCRDRSADRWLPWHVIQGSVPDAFLRLEFARGVEPGVTPP